MGFLSKLLGNDNQEGKSKQSYLDKNNIYDICYAFFILGFNNNLLSTSYIRIEIISNTVNIQAWISKEDCTRKSLFGLNTPQEIKTSVYYQDIADFIVSLNCTYDDDYFYQLHKNVEISNFTLSEDLLNETIEKAANLLSNSGFYFNRFFKVTMSENKSGAIVQLGKI